MAEPGLPERYLILTRRGDLHIDEVQVGDETLDANGVWTEITEIHRYPEQVIEHWHLPRKNANQAPEFSPEIWTARDHRWVHSQYRDRGGLRYSIEFHDPDRPLPKVTPEKYGKKLQFVPKTGDWIAKGHTPIIADTPRERGAALVAMMESSTKDCTFHWGTRTLEIWEPPVPGGISAELRSLIPENVIVHEEESYMTWDGKKYLVTIDPRKIENLPGADMLEWVRGVSQREVKAFFATYWYINGETRHESLDWPYRAKVPVRNYEHNRLRAMQLAAYRSGSLGRPVRTKGNLSEVKIGMVEGRTAAHKYALKDVSVEPTWGVTTESGTLTVWGPVNRRESAYIITGHERP